MENKTNDPWVVIEAEEQLNNFLYTVAHTNVKAGSYAKVQYINRIIKRYAEQEGEDVLMGHVIDSLHEMASSLETWLPKLCEKCGERNATHTDFHGTKDEEAREWDVCEPFKDELVKKFTNQLKGAGII